LAVAATGRRIDDFRAMEWSGRAPALSAEPQKIPQVISPDEARRLLAVADSLRTRLLLSLADGCGLRTSEVVRLKVKHIDTALKIIRIEQGKGRKDRNVMLSPEVLDLLRQWWRERLSRHDAGTPLRNVGCFRAGSLVKEPASR
jgi:integrase